VEILMGETEQVLNPYSGEMMLNRLDVSRPVMMYEEGTFEATATEVAPAVYLIPAGEQEALNKLQIHGVQMNTLGEEMTLPVQRFVISTSTASAQPFQGHNERTLEGAWEAAQATLPADTVVVRVDQPLGRLAFTLLEPRSDDGFTNWNVFDDALEGASVYPVLRTMEPLR
jgi:hypothetical protein